MKTAEMQLPPSEVLMDSRSKAPESPARTIVVRSEDSTSGLDFRAGVVSWFIPVWPDPTSCPLWQV
jgi:hypothetical protein